MTNSEQTSSYGRHAEGLARACTGGGTVPNNSHCSDTAKTSYVNPVSWCYVVSELLHGGIGRQLVNIESCLSLNRMQVLKCMCTTTLRGHSHVINELSDEG